MAKRRPVFRAYVLMNPRRAVYVGATRFLLERVEAHNLGRAASFTRSRPGLWVVAHSVIAPTWLDALAREAEWTALLEATGTLPFLDFVPTEFGPRVHLDHPNCSYVPPLRRGRAA